MDAATLTDLGRWLFILAMAALAVHDVLTFRIPNWANAAIAVAFVPFAVALMMAGAEVWWLGHLVAAAAVFAVGLVLFQFRAMGGGDVKLLTAAALWIGLEGVVPFVFMVGLAGGALVLVLLLLRRHLTILAAWALPRSPAARPRVLTAGEKVPYGVAIAIGAVMTVLGGRAALIG